jgi:hypothetical protein
MGGSRTALTVPISGNGELEIGEHLEQQRLELVVGFVHLVDQQHAAVLGLQRLHERARLEKLLGEEDVAELVQPAHRLGEAFRPLQHLVQGFFQHLGVEKLLAVFPLVDGLGFVEALVALQADQAAARTSAAVVLASSVLPTPGGPSMRIGFLRW